MTTKHFSTSIAKEHLAATRCFSAFFAKKCLVVAGHFSTSVAKEHLANAKHFLAYIAKKCV